MSAVKSANVLQLFRSVVSRVRHPRSAPRYDIGLDASLSVTVMPEESGLISPPAHARLEGLTRNVSESGVAVVVPSVLIGTHMISVGGTLRMTLDLGPERRVTMTAVVVRREPVGMAKHPDYLLGMKIIAMGESDHAAYAEYLRARSLEQTVSQSGEEVRL